MTTQLTDKEVDEINKTLWTLQNDVQDIIDSIVDENYESAIESVQKAMNHTECPVCRDKFTVIGADVVKAKMLCRLGDNKCIPQKNETIEFAKRVKDTFLPIATEKNIVNQHSIMKGNKPVYTKENDYKEKSSFDDINITPLNAPLVLIDNFMLELSK